MGLHRWPNGPLRSIGDEQNNDGSAPDSFINVEECFSRHPAIFESAVLGALTDDDIETVIAQVQRLCVALNAIADDSNGFILESLTRFGHGKLLARDNVFLRSSE